MKDLGHLATEKQNMQLFMTISLMSKSVMFEFILARKPYVSMASAQDVTGAGSLT